MLKKSLVAAGIVALVISAGVPASANPVFLESYTDIFDGRTLVKSKDDSRAGSVLQDAGEDVTSRWVVAPVFRIADLGGGAEVSAWGGSIAYATSKLQVGVDIVNFSLDAGGVNDRYNLAAAPTVKVGVLSRGNLTASVVGRLLHIDTIGSRWDGALAFDLGLGNSLFLTGNVGYSEVSPSGAADVDDFVAGVGATWRPAAWPKLSLSFNYVVDNDVDAEDLWGVSAQWALDSRSLVRLGAGKHQMWMGNLIYKLDR